MSLNDFQLPPFLAAGLYRDSLVDLATPQIKPALSKGEKLSFLGGNAKNILIVVEDETALHLPDEDLQFLTGILIACKICVDDIILINFNKNASISYKMLTEQFTPTKIICLGIDLRRLQFPLEFPHYQVQKYNKHLYLSAPSLKKLASNKDGEKQQLWSCLKKLFEI